MNPIALAADPATARPRSPVGAPPDATAEGTFDDLIARSGADGQASADRVPSGATALKPVTLNYPTLEGLPASAEAGGPSVTDAATSPSPLDLAPLLAKVVAAGGANPPVRSGGKDGGAVPDAPDPSGGAIAGVTVPLLLPGVQPAPLATILSSTAPLPAASPPAVGAGPSIAGSAAPADDNADATKIAPTLVSAVAIANHFAPAVPSPALLASAVGSVVAGSLKADPSSVSPAPQGTMPRVIVPASGPLVATASTGAMLEMAPSRAVTGTSDGAATGATAQSDATAAASLDPSRIAGPPSGSAEIPGPVWLDASAGTAPLVRGIADTIVRLASSSPSAVPTATDDPTVATPAITPARTMTLQLNPGSLGTISVRLHLTGGALDVRLGVSDPQTLGLIARERDTLVAALHDQSTSIHSLTIGGGDAPPPGGNDAPSQRPVGDQSSGDRPSGGGPGDRPAPDRRSAVPTDPLAPAAPEPGGALFV